MINKMDNLTLLDDSYDMAKELSKRYGIDNPILFIYLTILYHYTLEFDDSVKNLVEKYERKVKEINNDKNR